MPAHAVSRPTSDRVREAIFSRLETLISLQGAHVLDLFAGTGALGLEAASRGATAVWFVEKHPGAEKVIRANSATVKPALRHTPHLAVVRTSVQSFLDNTPPERMHAIFLDPPYDYPPETLDAHLGALPPWLAKDAIVMVERASSGSPPHFPEGLESLGSKTYGDTQVYWARAVKGSQPPD